VNNIRSSPRTVFAGPSAWTVHPLLQADAPPSAPVSKAGARPSCTLGFILFVALNATLFIRPGELLEALDGIQVYQILIILCALVSLPVLVPQFAPRALAERPVTVCVLVLWIAVVVSQLANGFNLYNARSSGFEFAKLVLYYLLLAGLVNTPRRLRLFLYWVAAFLVVITVITLLHYAGVIHFISLVPEGIPDTEEGRELLEILTARLYSTGCFNDPNDFALILLVGITTCVFGLTDRELHWKRLAWLGPLGLFGYAFALTQSRGGFIALLAGLLVLFHSRHGWLKTLALSVAVVPLAFFLFAGRQTSLTTEDESAQGRIQYWSEAFGEFRTAPFFGIGQNEFAEAMGHVVHNSFLHTFTELGFFAGIFFLGAFWYCLRALQRLSGDTVTIIDPHLRSLRPYVTALLAATAAGLLFLSRPYMPHTYMVPGLCAAYVGMAGTQPHLPPIYFGGRLLAAFVAASLVFLLITYLFVRAFVSWGV
jgi:hypothetical protein